MKKYLKAVVSGLCAAALALGCVGCGSSARKVMAYKALMRSDMEALRSPATIMKLAQEQGALYKIERLTFFKSLETFDHPRNMQIIAEGVETAAELRTVVELGADALQGYSLQTCRRTGQMDTCRPQGHCRVQLCIRQRLNTNIKSPAEMRGFLHLPLAYCSLLRYTGTGQTTAQEVLFYYGTGRPYHRLSGRRQNHLFYVGMSGIWWHRATMSAFWKTTSAQ